MGKRRERKRQEGWGLVGERWEGEVVLLALAGTVLFKVTRLAMYGLYNETKGV